MTREEAIRILDEVIPPPEHHTVDLDHLRIAQAWAYTKETLKAEPVRHGHWVKNYEYSDEIEGHMVYKCSECGELYDWFDVPEHKYCRHCGAKMDGGDL